MDLEVESCLISVILAQKTGSFPKDIQPKNVSKEEYRALSAGGAAQTWSSCWHSLGSSLLQG